MSNEIEFLNAYAVFAVCSLLSSDITSEIIILFSIAVPIYSTAFNASDNNSFDLNCISFEYTFKPRSMIFINFIRNVS